MLGECFDGAQRDLVTDTKEPVPQTAYFVDRHFRRTRRLMAKRQDAVLWRTDSSFDSARRLLALQAATCQGAC